MTTALPAHPGHRHRPRALAPAGSCPQARIALVRWTARIGAVTELAAAEWCAIPVAVARGRLLGAERVGLLGRARPLRDQPSLFTATLAGIRLAGLPGVEPTRVSAASARHAVACSEVAVALARAYPTHVLSGERELRRDEREHGAPLASACLSGGRRGRSLHRPDLVMWPDAPGALPLAVEVELSEKAPVRLQEICLAWARCRCVGGVLYIATARARRALGRAIERSNAGPHIAVVDLEALLGRPPGAPPARESPIPGAA